MNKTKHLKEPQHSAPRGKPGQTSQCLKDLRFHTVYNLVRDDGQLDHEESRQKALECLDGLEQDYPREQCILFLALEVIGRHPEPDVQAYYDRLVMLMQDAEVTKSTLEMILHLIHCLREWSLDLAVRSMEEFLLQRLTVEKHESFLHKVFIAYIQMQTSEINGLDTLVDFIPKLKCAWSARLSVDASHAALMFMWKKLDSALSSGDLEAAEQWGQLALDPMFSNMGDANRAKVQRKLIICAFRRHDVDPAYQFTGVLFEPEKSEPLTVYLLFKVVVLRKNDIDLASKCIVSLCRNDPDVLVHLFACIAEAQMAGKTALLRSAMRQVLDSVNKLSQGKVDIALLLKCTIRLDIEELEKTEVIDHSIVEHLCEDFELACKIGSYQPSEQGEFSLSDYEWFSRNSYNLALQHCCKWESHHILRLAEACLKILDLYPDDLGPEARSDLKLRGLMCDFLAAVISVILARTEYDIQIKEMLCTNAKTYFVNFRSFYQSYIEDIGEEFYSELNDKYRGLLAFDFEASIQLKEWDRLDILLIEARQLSNDKLYTILVDLILRSGAPAAERTRLFGTIVKNIQEQNLYNVPKTSRWLRCLFQIALESDVKSAEEVLSQTHTLAQRTSNRSLESERYPAEELEWLSATVYNQAIDLYLASDDAASRRWYELSVGFSKLLGDGGYLCQVLEKKFSALTWEE